MFIIFVVIFVGYFIWIDFMINIVFIFIGNMIGGVVFVGFIYFFFY